MIFCSVAVTVESEEVSVGQTAEVIWTLMLDRCEETAAADELVISRWARVRADRWRPDSAHYPQQQTFTLAH